MPAPYSSKSIANTIINHARQNKKHVDHMKLHKLTYYIHGYYLAVNNGQPLLNELFEAWKLGPVLPSLYDEFKEFGGDSITRYALTYSSSLGYKLPSIPANDEELVNFISSYVWKKYGNLHSYVLSDLTHKIGSPWYKVWHERGGKEFRNMNIPNEDIQNYFRTLVN